MDDLEIDRALDAVLSQEPSPEFVARVRTQIAEAPRPSIVAGWLKPAATVACAAVVAIVVGLPREEAPTTAAPKPAGTGLSPSATATLAVPPSSSTKPAVRPATPPKSPARAHVSIPTEPPLPEVIIAADDVEALRQLLDSLNEHTFVASFEETPVSTPWVMTSLSVAPIGGDPLDSPPAHNN